MANTAARVIADRGGLGEADAGIAPARPARVNRPRGDIVSRQDYPTRQPIARLRRASRRAFQCFEITGPFCRTIDEGEARTRPARQAEQGEDPCVRWKDFAS